MNSFELLSDDGWSQAPSKNKRKSKKKTGAVQEDQQGSAPAPVADDGFAVVKRGKQPKPNGPTAPSVNGHAPIDAANLVKEASSVSGTAKSQLLEAWSTRARQDPVFCAEIVKSRALEKLIASLAVEAQPKDAAPLAALLTAVVPSSSSSSTLPSDLPLAVAELTIASGTLAPLDSLAPSSEASKTAVAALATLTAPTSTSPSTTKKQADGLTLTPTPSGGGLTALKTLQSRLDSLEAALDRAATTKEQCRLTVEMGAAAQAAADLGDVGTGAAAFPEAAAALSALSTLRTALAARQKVVLKLAGGGAGGGGKGGASKAVSIMTTVEEDVATAQRQHAREDSVLAAEEAEAKATVADLELQLTAAKAKLKDLSQHRVAAAQVLQTTVDGLRQGAAATAAAAKQICTSVDATLAHSLALDGLLQSAIAASADKDAHKAVVEAWTAAEIPSRFASATRRHLEVAVKYLGELSGKISFYRQRLDASDRQAEHLEVLQDASAVAEHCRQRKGLESLLAEALAAGGAAEKTAMAAVEAWRARYARLRRQVGGTDGAAALASASSVIESLAARVVEAADGIAEGKSASVAPARPSQNDSKNKKNSKNEKNSNNNSKNKEKQPNGSATATTATTATTTTTANANTNAGKAVGVSSEHDSGSSSPSQTQISSELAILEQRLAALEEENKKKDAQIAAMLAAASVEIPSPPMPKSAARAWGGGGK